VWRGRAKRSPHADVDPDDAGETTRMTTSATIALATRLIVAMPPRLRIGPRV